MMAAELILDRTHAEYSVRLRLLPSLTPVWASVCIGTRPCRWAEAALCEKLEGR